MVEYEVENHLVLFDFEILSFLLCVTSFSRPSYVPQGLFVSAKNTSPDFWNMPFLDLIIFQ